MQVAEVTEVQLVVEHEALASQRVAEGSDSPKCKPVMVSCAAPDAGAFTVRDEDMTGAAKGHRLQCNAHACQTQCDASPATAHTPSKLNFPVKVPATSLTLTAVRTAELLHTRSAHATVVTDVHEVLPHTSAVAVIEAVTVGPTVPKFSPLIVTVPLPLGTALAEAVLTTGAA